MEVNNSHSILHDINSRQLHGFKGRKRPFFTYSTSPDTRNPEPSCSTGLSTSHHGLPTPPLSLSFAKTINNGHILGVSDEEGYVNLFDTRLKVKSSNTLQENAEKAIVSSWVAHDNSVYDICWIKDDTEILTASADHSMKVWDVEQRKCIGMLMGHTGSVKTVCSHPTKFDIVVSGSRDGSFALWDLRCKPGRGEDWITPNEQVNGAHTSAKRKRFMKGKAASMTVTSVLYMKDEVSIATAGAADSIVKFWDTRNLRASTAQASPHLESTTEKVRPHGITSLSQELSGVLISASCTDNRIYLYNVLQLEKGPVSSFTGCQIGTFFVKSAISSDGSHILSGSGDGNAYLWQVDDPQKDPVALTSHDKEVTAVDWSPQEPGKIATASDDFTVRFWNIDNRHYLSPRSLPAQRKVVGIAKADCEELPLDKGSPRSLRHAEIVQETSLQESMKTPEATAACQSHRCRSISGVNLNEAFDKTPESAVRSPSSVLTPPCSMKKKTIRDYFLVN